MSIKEATTLIKLMRDPCECDLSEEITQACIDFDFEEGDPIAFLTDLQPQITEPRYMVRAIIRALQ